MLSGCAYYRDKMPFCKKNVAREIGWRIFEVGVFSRDCGTYINFTFHILDTYIMFNAVKQSSMTIIRCHMLCACAYSSCTFCKASLLLQAAHAYTLLPHAYILGQEFLVVLPICCLFNSSPQ